MTEYKTVRIDMKHYVRLTAQAKRNKRNLSSQCEWNIDVVGGYQ